MKTKAKEMLDYLDEDKIYEMSNIPFRVHKLKDGIKLNVLQPGKEYPHPERVKIMKRGEKDFLIRLSVDVLSIKIVKGESFLSGKELRELMEYIKKYRIPLLMLWHDSFLDIDDYEVLVNKIEQGQEFEIKIPGHKGTNKKYKKVKK